jgi:hypothetical protein
MKQNPVYSLGQEFQLAVPESVSEYDQLAKKDGAALESAIANAIFRGYLPEWRTKFVEELEKVSGVKREVDAEGTPTGTDASENKYAERVYATIAKDEGITPDAAKAKFAGLAQEVASKIAFDPSKKERTGGGSNLIAKTYIKIATEAFDGGKIQMLADKLANFGFALTSPLTGDKDADVLAVAKLIAARQKKINEEKNAELAV